MAGYQKDFLSMVLKSIEIFIVIVEDVTFFNAQKLKSDIYEYLQIYVSYLIGNLIYCWYN